MSNKAKIAINGFGRIGRAFFRLAVLDPNLEIVAINDLGDINNLAYLLQYDTVYGRSPLEISVEGTMLVVNGQKITFISERDQTKLPWGDLGIDIVLEATGVFAGYDKSKFHLEAGAKRVVISAPVKDDPAAAGVVGGTVLMGVNEDTLAGQQISSNASCTTNAASPLIGILKESIGIEKALLNTVHAYTATQSLVDGPSKKDLRSGRAAAQNIIPSSTGAAIATTLAHSELAGKFDGIAMRVPVPVGSIVDITFVASRETTVEEVNAALTEAAASSQWQDIFAVTTEPIVSSDIIGAPYASIADLSFTRVAGGNLVKVLAWYDNETSYTHTLVKHVIAAAAQLPSA
ncbi:type I glyceraldehyde-3-phosphate dehydrogenase [Candidatus Kaiserbacteria bacterium]|nr:type I glyceraldehyde-3-phosphate dehydrogenase [Candidatus Kaiserbacteria bacterium]MCB9811715.1 type I glyceraldehyde-3-phosphate dehydrogenase [Candidatus Nomurabacteria bacterium]